MAQAPFPLKWAASASSARTKGLGDGQTQKSGSDGAKRHESRPGRGPVAARAFCTRDPKARRQEGGEAKGPTHGGRSQEGWQEGRTPVGQEHQTRRPEARGFQGLKSAESRQEAPRPQGGPDEGRTSGRSTQADREEAGPDEETGGGPEAGHPAGDRSAAKTSCDCPSNSSTRSQGPGRSRGATRGESAGLTKGATTSADGCSSREGSHATSPQSRTKSGLRRGLRAVASLIPGSRSLGVRRSIRAAGARGEVPPTHRDQPGVDRR